MSKQAFKRLRRRVGLEVNRKPLDAYAWPGGYQMYYVCDDGGALCPKCVNAEIDNIEDSIRRGIKDGWSIAEGGAQVNYEDDQLNCDHCGDRIPPSYGD